MDLISTSASDLSKQMRDGTLSAADLMEQTYAQIAKWNPQVNAIVQLIDKEDALCLARAADAKGPTGPLHGLPIAIKDLANAAGFVTTMGSPALKKSAPAKADDVAVARIRAAGAIIIGKTNTPMFGLGSHTTNPVYGATRNPWNLEHTTGGSSGGGAVALATGMLPIADGSDMMGSLRNPTGWTNTYGLRPTWGAVPTEPQGDSFLHQLATNGPMARTPADLALLLDVLSGPDPRQPHGLSLEKDAAERPMRIGWLGNWEGACPTEDGILQQCETALEIFATLGHTVETCPAPFPSDAIWQSWTTLRSWQVASSLSPLATQPNASDAFNTQAIWEYQRGTKLSAMEVHKASVTRSQWYRRAAKLFERYDVLALPTAQCWPFKMTLDWPKQINGHEMDSYHRWMEVAVPASLIGLPTIAAPAGFGEAGLPIGLQLIGPRGSDYKLINHIRKYHQNAPWITQRPKFKA